MSTIDSFCGYPASPARATIADTSIDAPAKPTTRRSSRVVVLTLAP
jgi:hypothetical protein